MKGIKSLVIVGVLLLVVGIIGVMFTFDNVSEKVLEKKQIPDEDFNAIDIHTGNAKVEVIATEDATPKVELSGDKSKGSELEYKVNVTDDTLFVQLKERQKKLYSFDFGSRGLTLKVYVPEQEYESLNIAHGDGEIYMNHLKVKEINATISDGRIKMKDIEGSTLTAGADDGSIHADNMQVDDVKMTARDGKLELTQVESTIIRTEIEDGKIVMDDVGGEVIGKASDGSISMVTEDLERPIAMEIDDGSITIQTRKKPENVAFDVHVDDGMVNLFGEFKGSTVIGDGDNLVKLAANDGSIVVK